MLQRLLSRGKPSMPPKPPIHLLVTSIGNPPPLYENTLHSAGHTVLESVRAGLGYTAFKRDRAMGNGLVSRPPRGVRFSLKGMGFVPDPNSAPDDPWTLWQSTSLMNVSGKGVREAWERWKREVPEGVEGLLVVLHDELEKPLGKVVVRKTAGSARGHNGIKSIQAALPRVPFVRIGIGIGRPLSRDPEAVSKHVLRKMTDDEFYEINNCVGEVIAALRDLSDGK